MQQPQLTLTLTLEEVQILLQVLGDIPTKSGLYPLVMKIKDQAEAQLTSAEPSTEAKE